MKRYILEGKDFVCPSCGSDEFSNILNYGLAPQHYYAKGLKYMFVTKCLTCKAEITYYCAMGKSPKRKGVL